MLIEIQYISTLQSITKYHEYAREVGFEVSQ
jgi:hypothetical protein